MVGYASVFTSESVTMMGIPATESGMVGIPVGLVTSVAAFSELLQRTAVHLSLVRHNFFVHREKVGGGLGLFCQKKRILFLTE